VTSIRRNIDLFGLRRESRLRLNSNRFKQRDPFMARVLYWISRLDARHRIVIALAGAAIVFFSLRGSVRASTDAIASWDTFAFSILALAWLVILRTPQTNLRARAQAQDVSHLVIFIFVVIAASVALFAVGFVLGASKSATHLGVHLVLTLGTVILSWALVHTVFGLRYAHSFYGDSDEPKQDRHAGGLIFPGERAPDYFDFAYYAFVVGMTCQVSDVQITSRKLRRLTLVHSLLAFGFNTIILALLINIVSSLI
jgi:uncharacterized membrane protein